MPNVTDMDLIAGLSRLSDALEGKYTAAKQTVYVEKLGHYNMTLAQWEQLQDRLLEECDRFPSLAQIGNIFFADKNRERFNSQKAVHPWILCRCSCGRDFAVRERDVLQHPEYTSDDCPGVLDGNCNVRGISYGMIAKQYDREKLTFDLKR